MQNLKLAYLVKRSIRETESVCKEGVIITVSHRAAELFPAKTHLMQLCRFLEGRAFKHQFANLQG
jgi:hypothetical protein